MQYKIIHTNTHLAVYINGKFYCTARTMIEAMNRIEEFKNKGEAL